MVEKSDSGRTRLHEGMKLMAKLIAVELLELRAHRARIEAADISAEAEAAGIVPIIEDPVTGVALKP